MRPYSPGGILIEFSSAQKDFYTPHTKYSSFTARTTGVSNPVRSPGFRASASVSVQEAAFATGVPPNIYAFHRYTGNSTSLSSTPAPWFLQAVPQLSRGLSPITSEAAYAPFTPSNSEQRLPPPYYRGCWHGVSRGFLQRYRHCLRPSGQEFTIRKLSSSTRRCWVRLAPIAQNSPLLPPVGVWAVSQSQCGRPSSQTGYRSTPR